MAEEVLINIKIDGTQNEAKIDSLTASIIDLQNANKQLAEQNKALAKAEGDNTKAIVENAKQIEFNKQKITENTAERKGLIQSIMSEDNSIKALSIRNAQLIKERNLINTGTEEGRKRIQAINAQLDKNNATIRENSSALEKQKINIGNYASALDGIVPGLGGFVNGIQGATTASKAFIATPIGAVLAVVAAALGTLSAAIKTNDALGDEFGKRWDQISAVFDVVIRRVGVLGEALISLVKGDFAEAADKAKEAFAGANDELARAIVLTGALADRQNELDDALNKFNATEKARQNQVDKLIIQSKDLSKTEAERLALSTKAESILNDLTKERIDLAKRQSDIDLEAIGLKFDQQRKLNETTQEYGLRLLENSKIGGEEAEKISAAIRKVDEAEAESIRTLEKLQNQQNKLGEDIVKVFREDSEQTKQIRERNAEDNLNLQIETQEESLQLTTSFEESVFNTKKAFAEKDKKLKEEQKKYTVEIEKQKFIALQALQAQAFGVARQLAGQNKALQSGLTLIDTYFSAQRAYASQLIPGDPTSLPRAIAAAVLSVVSGLARVAQINGVQFAYGGIAQNGGVLNGPSHAQGGIPFAVGGRVGFEAEGGEAIINKRSTAMFKPMLSAINVAGGGRAFATGGITGNEVRAATSQAQNAFNASQIASLMNQVRTVLVLQDFEAVQTSRDTTVNKAQVLG